VTRLRDSLRANNERLSESSNAIAVSPLSCRTQLILVVSFQSLDAAGRFTFKMKNAGHVAQAGARSVSNG